MTDRYSPADILNAHFKGLKNRTYTTARPVGRPDRAARWVLYVAPLAAGVAAYWFNARLASPGDLMGAVGLLAGAFFMGFTQVASWRERFTARLRERPVSEVHQRDSLDEVVAHVLVAIYACGVLLVLLVVGINFTDKEGDLTGVWAALVIAVGLYVLLLLALVLPKLYTAYAGVNEVDDEMSGLHR